MRTRLILPALAAALGLCASATSCQIIAGLTVLDVTGGTGGAGTGTGGTGGGPPPCMPNMPCGGHCTGSTLIPAGTCTPKGVCPVLPTACPDDYACDSNGMMCRSSCTDSTECSTAALCVPGPGMGGTGGTGGMSGMGTMECHACGIVPPTSACPPGCPSCDGNGTCTTTCTGNCGNGTTVTVEAGMGKARLQCGAECNNVTIDCQGPFGCEIVCGTGGCTHMVLNCDTDKNGPCSITCASNSCGMSTVNCGENTCATTCMDGSPITKKCKHGCCTNDTCKLSN